MNEISKYEYPPTNINFVKENPEEYIIPDCLEACKILWGKGIITNQCSNYDDTFRYIEINSLTLSDENKKIIYDMVNSGELGFMIGNGLIHPQDHEPRIYTEKVGVEASEELCRMADILKLQDTKEFMTSDAYLDDFKRRGGEYTYDSYGNVYREYNPAYVNATLEDALTVNEDWDLFIAEEGKIYFTKEALEYHYEYLKKLNQNLNNIF